jgi:acetolactate synthase I/II/III large subunit
MFEILRSEDVDTIFGYPGGAVIDIYHYLPDYPIRHVLTRHEQAAVHAADGYARTSGKTGVCLVTSGPGATNTVSGIASAFMDSIPLIILTGQVPTHMVWNDAFQQVDIVGITRPCTKHNYLVDSIDNLGRIVREAFYIARSGRPGPVLVDLPKDVMTELAEFTMPPAAEVKSYKPNYQPHAGQITKALQLMVKAVRPVIFGGGGVILAKASDQVRKLAETLSIPVTTSLMGLGGFPATHPLWLGMLGMHGTYQANMAVSECDVLIAIGARFDDRVTAKVEEFAPGAKIIHIDIDPTSIRKNISVAVPIVGDCRLSLELLNKMLAEKDLSRVAEDRKPWLAQIETWNKSNPLSYEQQPDGDIKPQFVIDQLYRHTNGRAIITTDVGQHQMWAAQFYRFDRPNSFITSGGLGCMGFGLPAAIGAQIAQPEQLVVNISGDGSIQMNIQELATAVENRLPIKIVILNNRCLGMVRQWQQVFKQGKYVATIMGGSPDFVRLAEAYGAMGLRAERVDEVETVIREGLAADRTVVMEFKVAQKECVSPMVAAGEPISRMLMV